MYFPDPTRNGGIPYEHFDEVPRDFGNITDSYEYEDGGKDFNRRTSNPPRIWNLTFIGGLTKSQTDQFDEFWETVGIDTTFDFEDKYGAIWANVRVMDYSRSHDAHKAWDKRVAFTLIQYSALPELEAPTLSTGTITSTSIEIGLS